MDLKIKNDIKNLIYNEDDDLIKEFTDFENLYIYNLVEELNKNAVYFMALFYQMANKKGHSVEFDNSDDEPTPENEKYLKIDKDELIIDKVVNSDTITPGQLAELLKKVDKNTITKDEKIKLQKHFFMKNMGLDTINKYVFKTSLIYLSLQYITINKSFRCNIIYNYNELYQIELLKLNINSMYK